MIHSIFKSIGTTGRQSVALGLLLLLSACADKGAIREAENERYRQLESEMISAQHDDVQRRRAELRLAQRLQQLDTERSAGARHRLQSESLSSVADKESDVTSVASDTTASLPSQAVVTQVVVAQSGPNTEPWELQNYPDPTNGTPLCALVSRPVVVMNGKLETRARVIIGTQRLFLRTDATFDSEATETGFRVDAGIPIAFDRFINELTAEVNESYDRLLSAIEGGSSLAVSFAFLPQLSSAETHVIEIGLQNLEAALPRLASCETQSPERVGLFTYRSTVT